MFAGLRAVAGHLPSTRQLILRSATYAKSPITASIEENYLKLLTDEKKSEHSLLKDEHR
jgi:hypothetical protein